MTTAATIEMLAYHAGQQQLLDERARFNVVCFGRRCGKTIFAEDLAIDVALSGYPVGWFAPDYKIMMDAWREMLVRFDPVIANSNATEKRIEVVGGGSVEFWTLNNPKAGRSRKYARVIIDEAAHAINLQDVWEFAIKPTMIDYPESDAYFLSTPNGKNYFERLYNRGQDSLNTDWYSLRLPSTANTYLPGMAQEVEEARRELPELRFQQEYLAEFIEGGGVVFRNVRACIDVDMPTTPQEGRGYYMGVDWGQTNDFTVLIVVDDTGGVVAVDRFNKIGWDVQRDRLQALAEFWGVVQIEAELNSIGSPNVEALQSLGLPVRGFTTTNESKAEIIQALVLAFERSETRIPDNPVLISELESIEATRLPSGKWRYAAPDGMHDDMPIAFALAWRARQSGGFSFDLVEW